MPRVNSLIWQERNQRNLKYLIKGRMKEAKVSQEDIAQMLNITQPALSHRLETMKFTWIELVTIFDVLDISGIEVAELVEQR